MNEVSKSLVCICIRNGVEIWVEEARAQNLVAMFTAPNPPQFVSYEGRLINRADLVGIFNPFDMEEHTRRKNGEWKCKRGTWHPRHTDCECREKESPWVPPTSELSEEQILANKIAIDKIRKTVGKKIF